MARPAVSLTNDAGGISVFDGGAASSALAASKAFFTSSPAAVVLSVPAPEARASTAETAATDEARTGAAAAAATGLGVPLLVLEPGNRVEVTAELERLGADTVVTYETTGGTPADSWETALAGMAGMPGPSDSEGFRSSLGLATAPAGSGSLVSAVAEMAAGAELGVPGLPAAAAPAPGGVPAPSGGPASGTAMLPEFDRAVEPVHAVVLASADPSSAPAVATARAAGAKVRVVASEDPRADPETIALLRSNRDGSIHAVGAGFGGQESFSAATAVALDAAELPGGGQTIFPGRRFVALYGHPGGASLGVLGEQGVDASIQRARETAAQYQPFSAEPVVPSLEIIATVASAEAGEDGDYSAETPVRELLPWVDAAEKAGVYVVLDLQPGNSTFLDQARLYEELLKRPHVGLALDAEWRLAPGQRHLEQIGSVDAAEINETAAWLAQLTRENVLPQKLLMLHQFNSAMIRNREQVDVGHSELALSLHADGHGTPGEKLETWNTLRAGLQPEILPGWKNFYDEDTPTLTPEQTFTDILPKPWFISYQ